MMRARARYARTHRRRREKESGSKSGSETRVHRQETRRGDVYIDGDILAIQQDGKCGMQTRTHA